jgi:hypothetical protein
MFDFIGNEHSDTSVDGYHPDYFATGCSERIADHGSFSGAQQTGKFSDFSVVTRT